MKKWLYILLACLPVLSCVGQKDDPVDPDNPDDQYGPVVGPADEGKDFFRRSLVLDFTGTWCVNCPKMEAAIADAMERRPGRFVPVSVHCMMIDPMYAKPLSDDLVKRFGVSAYPSVVVDLDPESLISASSAELILAHADRLLETRGKSSGIRVESASADGKLSVKMEAKAVREGEFTLSILLLEDGIVASQTGAEDGNAHVHDNVLREWTDGAPVSLKEGETGVLEMSAAVSGNCRIVALLCRNGLVDNVMTCAAGATAEYEYEETNE